MNCPYLQENDGVVVCVKFDDVPDCLKDYPHFMNRVCILCPDSLLNKYGTVDPVKVMEYEIKKLPLMSDETDNLSNQP